MTRYMSTAAATAIALAMTATSAVAQEAGQGGEAGQGEATTFDMDHPATAGGAPGPAFEDFNKGFTEWGVFDRLDADRDEFLTRDELGAGIYGAYDADRDEILTEDEVVGMGENRMFGGEPYEWFEWRDQQVAEEDFQAGIRDWGTYETWDADADDMLSRDEMSRGLFNAYDVDRDGYLSEDEAEALEADRIFTL